MCALTADPEYWCRSFCTLLSTETLQMSSHLFCVLKRRDVLAAIEDKYRKEVKARAAAETMLDKLKSVTRTELKRLKQDNDKLLERLQAQSNYGQESTVEIAGLKDTIKVCEFAEVSLRITRD